MMRRICDRDPRVVFDAVYSIVAQTGHYQHLLSVLHHLLVIPSESLEYGRSVWILVDNAICSALGCDCQVGCGGRQHGFDAVLTLCCAVLCCAVLCCGVGMQTMLKYGDIFDKRRAIADSGGPAAGAAAEPADTASGGDDDDVLELPDMSTAKCNPASARARRRSTGTAAAAAVCSWHDMLGDVGAVALQLAPAAWPASCSSSRPKMRSCLRSWTSKRRPRHSGRRELASWRRLSRSCAQRRAQSHRQCLLTTRNTRRRWRA